MFNIDVKIIKRNDRGEITHSEDFDIFKVPVLPRIGAATRTSRFLKPTKGNPTARW